MTKRGFIPRASVVLCGTLVTVTLAHAATAGAQEPPKTAATPAIETPKVSAVEIGFGDVTDGSYKAGEYNGLQKKGGLAVGNFDLRDNAAYDGTSATRWHVTGVDLGLGTRSVGGDFRQQGKFQATFLFDQLRRNRSDSYQTPYSGTGTDVLTLPATWLVPTVAGSSTTNSVTNVLSARGLSPSIGTAPYIDIRTTSTSMGAVLTPTAAQTGQVNTAAAADLAAFRNVNLFTTRTSFEAGLSYHFNDRWGFDASVRPEHKDGTKPMGTVSRNTGGDISTIIPDQIDQNHNQIDSNLSYKGARTFAQVGYYGSYFRNNVRSMSWQNWATGPTGTLPGTVNVMGSAPSSDFSQIAGSAGYKISSATRFVANGTYARSTQNDTFLTDETTPVVPVRSLDGLVVTTLFNAKLTTRIAKKLNLTGAYKYNDRDNRTPVNIYQYADTGEAAAANASFPAGPGNPLGAVLAQNANANRPYGTKLNQLNFDGDYALGGGQWIKGGYDFQKIDRACHGSWIDCADVATTNENTLRADWRASVGTEFTARAGYAYSSRRGSTYNENAFLALVPYANVSPLSATGGATALSFMNANGWQGWGPALGFATTTGNMNVYFPSNNALANAMYANGNRISELPGLRRYYVADRNRDKVRTSLDWQASDAWSLQGGVDLNKDHFPDATYGLQDAKGWAGNFDVTYSPTDNMSANVFYTYEKLRSLTDGNTYTANSNASTITNGQPGVVGLTGNACDGYTTLQQRNNNKLDPCLPWSSDTLDEVNTVGLGLRRKQDKLDLLGSLTFARARSDTPVTGGNWANNLLNGPGAAPTTFAASLIAATAFPTVSSDTTELRLSGTWALAKAQSLRVAYAYLHMTSSDWIYEGMQTGIGTLSGVLPSNEQPFNYKVNAFALSYLVSF